MGVEGIREAAAEEAALSLNYVVLTVAACLIATLGLLENSAAVIIGAMIVAPLIGPIQAFAYGALAGDVRLVRRAVLTAATGAAISVAVSAALGAAVGLPSADSEIVARTRPNLLDLAIALAAGGVAGFAQLRPAIGNAIAGTAIAVALMPPLCVVGLGLSAGDASWARGALLLFGTNFLGIAFACMLVYLAGRVVRSHSRVGLLATAAVTAALVVPLGASLLEIVREARIEASIRHELTADTQTFKRVGLIAARFDWYTDPLSATLDVSAPEPITPSQVRDLESFVATRTGRKIALAFRVSRYETVTDAARAPVAPAPGTERTF